MTLKEKIAEFVELARSCPEKLQETCFQVLLEDYLSSEKTDTSNKKKQTPATDTPTEKLEETTKQQGDITPSDVHVRVKRFMEKQGISLEDLNLVFYKEGESFRPLYDSLGTTKTSQSQIRVTLMRCLESAFGDGEFQVDIEQVRSECQLRKCYDNKNFNANFANNAHNARLFDFKKFTKDIKTLRLSDVGKAELAEVIKERK